MRKANSGTLALGGTNAFQGTVTVAGGYLKSIPEAPKGKKFAIDKKLQVYLTHE